MEYVAELQNDDDFEAVDPLPEAIRNAHLRWFSRMSDHLREHGDPGSLALLRSANYELSGSWLNAVFQTGRYVGELGMNNSEFHDALLIRLLLNPVARDPLAGGAVTCHCHTRVNLSKDCTHALDCVYHNRYYMDKRHNMVRDHLAKWLSKHRNPGFNSRVEKEAMYGDQDGKRADVAVFTDGGDQAQVTWIDVAVCNPAAVTYRDQNDSHIVAEGAAERIYRGKIAHYSQFLNATSVIQPFVIESTGRIYRETANFIIDKFRPVLKDPLRDLHARCAVLIQRYNARMAASLRVKTTRRR
jgi:hypothetical protein